MPVTSLTPTPNTGNDTVSTTRAGIFSADLGNGNDLFDSDYPADFTVLGGSGNDTIEGSYSGLVSVDLGSGNDSFVSYYGGDSTGLVGGGSGHHSLSQLRASHDGGAGRQTL